MDIATFFRGRTVFITGASGFMGKTLVEKLLRSCPDIKQIYLLLRPKRGKNSIERLEEITSSEIFSVLKQQRPTFINQIVVISGNIAESNLGISEEDRTKLISEVNIVFHLAATVRFDECLRTAIQLNITSVQRLIDLIVQFKELLAFVHTSTAYANCERNYVSEAVYTLYIEPEWLMEAAEWMSSDALDAITPFILENRPNTYTLTKAIAEGIIEKAVNEKKLKAAIFRPSIISCTVDEPVSGWVDNFNGPSGIYASIGKGMLRTMMGNPDAIADLVPVDICVKMLIAIAWKISQCVNGEQYFKVYHCTSGQLKNPCTWGLVEKISNEAFKSYIPLENPILVPSASFTNNRILYAFRKLLEQLLPAYIMDLYLRCKGKCPLFLKIQDRINNSVKSLEYFTLNQWQFSQHNAIDLLESLSELDKMHFNFDLSHINWERYIYNHCIGTKKYVLREDMNRYDQCVQQIKRLWKIQIALTAVIPIGIVITSLYKFPYLRILLFTLFRIIIYTSLYFPMLPLKRLVK